MSWPALPSHLRPIRRPSVPSAESEDEGIRRVLRAPSSSEVAPMPSRRDHQNAPSSAPYGDDSSSKRRPPKAFVIKVLDRPAELARAYRLRYQVYEPLGYLQQTNRAKIELDPYDRYAIPFGVISVGTGELVGTIRLIRDRVQTPFADMIQHILHIAEEPKLSDQAMAPRKRALPSMVSDLVEEMLRVYNPDHQDVVELSRYIFHPNYRGTEASRWLLDFAIAYAMLDGHLMVLGGCLPKHVPLYACYGFKRLPGTELDHYAHVGQAACTVICNTKALPEPTNSHTEVIRKALGRGRPECLLQECAGGATLTPDSVWPVPLRQNEPGMTLKKSTHLGGARSTVR